MPRTIAAGLQLVVALALLQPGQASAGPPKRPSEKMVDEVAEGLPGHPDAKSFIETHHSSGRYVAARFRFGWYRRGELVGAAVFSHLCNDRVLTNVFGGRPTDSVELRRFVLLDEVPFNGESWFLARCLRALRQQERHLPRSGKGRDASHPARRHSLQRPRPTESSWP